MKNIGLIIVGALFSLSVIAQTESSSNQGFKPKKPVTEKRIRTWSITDAMGTVDSVSLDTVMNDFFVTNPAYNRTIGLEYLGNLGSPAQSLIFEDRKLRSSFLFFRPYEIYYMAPEDLIYYNTQVPFTSLNYYSGGPSNREERRINGVFTVNVNPKLNFGLYGDWINAYGVYASQSTRDYNGGFFGSYMGRHNELMFNVGFNGYENYENGGLTEMADVTDPNATGDLEAQNMPVFFEDNVWNKVVNRNVYLNYKYHIGIDRKVQVTEDSVSSVFVPVTSFFYTFRNEVDYKKYYEKNVAATDSFYLRYDLDTTKYINNAQTQDSSRFWQMKHTAGIMLNEEFNTLMKFGLSAYFTADVKRYTYAKAEAFYSKPDTLDYNCQLAYEDLYRYKYGVGARLSKHLGQAFTYDFYGEYFLFDEKETQKSYNLGGCINSDVDLWKQKVMVGAEAQIESSAPDYFEENYFSNRIRWADKNFEHKQKRSLFGYLSLPTFSFYKGLGLTFKAGVTNLDNYIYWNDKAQPIQCGDNVEVMNLSVKENFKLWFFHLDNELTYQHSSNEYVVPLPKLTSFSKFYFQYDNLFKVLTFQIGMDMRYNSKYYAPSYFPATGQFYNQREQKFGDYPYMDAFLNCHLKRARFFVVYNHINKGWFGNDYIA
ncbi:MAG: putative porin, partial [Paludibacteraceae bacterium]